MSRAAGLVAFVLLSLSVALGLAQSSGLLRRTLPAADSVDIHSYVSLAAFYTTLFHLLILPFGRYVNFTLADLLLPLHSGYHTIALSLGILALYIALGTIARTSCTTVIRHPLPGGFA